MKRNLLVLMVITLLALALMTACSPKAEAPTAAPAVTAPTAYPAKQEPAAPAATAYPVAAATTAPATSGKLTDAQVLALIEKQLDEHHTVDFLLSKKFTADQWVEVINNEFHNDVIFTADELDQVVAYLIANQK